MIVVKNISEAKSQLSALIEAAQNGAEVIIGDGGNPVARLTAYRGTAQPRVPGALAGEIFIANDFDGPLPMEVAEGFGVIVVADHA